MYGVCKTMLRPLSITPVSNLPETPHPLARHVNTGRTGGACQPARQKTAADCREENLMRVHNVNGTSSNTCKCGSWLKHWEKFSRRSLPSYCPESSCYKKPTVGAHVQKDSSTDKGWYIVPLCDDHNRQTGKSLNLSDSISLVSANVSETCGKRY